MKIINLKKKKNYYKRAAEICYICKEKFENKYSEDKKYCKVRDHCFIQEYIEVVCIAYVI